MIVIRLPSSNTRICAFADTALGLLAGPTRTRLAAPQDEIDLDHDAFLRSASSLALALAAAAS